MAWLQHQCHGHHPHQAHLLFHWLPFIAFFLAFLFSLLLFISARPRTKRDRWGGVIWGNLPAAVPLMSNIQFARQVRPTLSYQDHNFNEPHRRWPIKFACNCTYLNVWWDWFAIWASKWWECEIQRKGASFHAQHGIYPPPRVIGCRVLLDNVATMCSSVWGCVAFNQCW